MESDPTVNNGNVAAKPSAGAAGVASCGVHGAGELGKRGERCGPPDIPIAPSFEKRRLNLRATPRLGTFLSILDMDLTVDCNLRCTYCFKEKWNEHMEEQVAFDAITWFLYASGPVADLRVNFMGGEPMIRFPLIKRLVPFAKRRAWQMGKLIHFGITTNCTLVTDAVIEFWKKWGMGFHTSIDGTPEIQDHNRPTVGGRGSSRLVQRSVPKILGYRPLTMARSTVMPEAASSLVKSYRYFRTLGYVSIGFVPAAPALWVQEAIALFETQFCELADILIEEFRGNRFVHLMGIDSMVDGIVRNQRPQHACGAGRGMVLIDVHGDIWPCHRWNRQSEQAWRIGNIYETFDDRVRAELDVPCQSAIFKEVCESCAARLFCGGGCPAENLEETGDPFTRHPNACELTRVVARAGQKVHDTLYGEGNPLFLKHYYERDNRLA